MIEDGSLGLVTTARSVLGEDLPLIAADVLSGAAGVVAVILAARRASRLNILEALQYE
jgi:hypothetical protein